MEEKELTLDCIKNIGHSIHWLRAAKGEDIKTCADSLYLAVQEIEELERGNSFYVDLGTVSELARHYGEKICISIGD